jgi:hypothetical protein
MATKPRNADEARALLGKRTPLPGAGQKPGANWDRKEQPARGKSDEEPARASDVFRSGNGAPIATNKRMRKAGL